MLMRKTPQQGAIWHLSEPLGICGPSRRSQKLSFFVSGRPPFIHSLTFVFAWCTRDGHVLGRILRWQRSQYHPLPEFVPDNKAGAREGEQPQKSVPPLTEWVKRK
jgi:hypothetical protein